MSPQILFLLIGVVLGAASCAIPMVIIGRLKSKISHDKAIAEVNGEIRSQQERLAATLQDTERLRTEIETLRPSLATANSDAAGSKARCIEFEKRVSELEGSIDKKEAKLDELNRTINNNRATIAELQTQMDAERKQTEEKLLLLTEARDQLKTEFQNLANNIFDEKAKKFSEQNKTNLDLVLNPFREQLGDFKKKVEDVYVNESKDRHALSEHIKILTDLNVKVSKDAENLSRALKGENKTQGNWGEMILVRALELSGLTEGKEYDTQVSALDESGKRMQPDVIVHLPEGKDVIVDSKASLTAYEVFVNAENDADRDNALASHIISIRSHIDELSKKSYESLKKFNSLDFVLMFMPIEAAFVVAIRQEPHLFEYAYAKRVIIVSPSTLLVTLRTIQNMWQSEYQNRNAQEIAKKAADLYDKFAGFAETMLDVQKSIDAASDKCEKAVKQLSTGSGNIVRKIEDFKKMGVKPRKSLPEPLLDSDAIEESLQDGLE